MMMMIVYPVINNILVLEVGWLFQSLSLIRNTETSNRFGLRFYNIREMRFVGILVSDNQTIFKVINQDTSCPGKNYIRVSKV